MKNDTIANTKFLIRDFYTTEELQNIKAYIVAIIEERQNSDYRTLSGILIGVGFLLILISFGARRKRGSTAKKTEKKPET